MSNTRYLVAKYVPDVFRNEPFNVGVIVWNKGTTTIRFIGEKGDGSIDGRRLPEIVKSTDAYKQWFESWKKLLAKDQIRHPGGSEYVSRNDPRFLDVVQLSGRGNYILEQGGEILEETSSEEISKVAEHLFARLVRDPNDPLSGKSAEEVRDELLTEARVSTDPRVKRNQAVPIQVGGKTVHQEFHLYIGNGTPEWLAQVVPLTSQPKEIKKTAESIAWRFQSVLNANKVKAGRCIAMIYSPDQRQDEMIRESLCELESVAKIFDVGGKSRANLVNSIHSWVQSAQTHPDHDHKDTAN